MKMNTKTEKLERNAAFYDIINEGIGRAVEDFLSEVDETKMTTTKYQVRNDQIELKVCGSIQKRDNGESPFVTESLMAATMLAEYNGLNVVKINFVETR